MCIELLCLHTVDLLAGRGGAAGLYSRRARLHQVGRQVGHRLDGLEVGDAEGLSAGRVGSLMEGTCGRMVARRVEHVGEVVDGKGRVEAVRPGGLLHDLEHLFKQRLRLGVVARLGKRQGEIACRLTRLFAHAAKDLLKDRNRPFVDLDRLGVLGLIRIDKRQHIEGVGHCEMLRTVERGAQFDGGQGRAFRLRQLPPFPEGDRRISQLDEVVLRGACRGGWLPVGTKHDGGDERRGSHRTQGPPVGLPAYTLR